MRTNTQIRIHEPGLVVPDNCVENCRGLKKAVGEALLGAAKDPDSEYVVVCDRARKLGCSARVLYLGFYDTFGQAVEGSSERFLPSPAIIETGLSKITVPEIIEKAREAGSTNHSISELR